MDPSPGPSWILHAEIVPLAVRRRCRPCDFSNATIRNPSPTEAARHNRPQQGPRAHQRHPGQAATTAGTHARKKGTTRRSATTFHLPEGFLNGARTNISLLTVGICARCYGGCSDGTFWKTKKKSTTVYMAFGIRKSTGRLTELQGGVLLRLRGNKHHGMKALCNIGFLGADHIPSCWGVCGGNFAFA